MIELQLPKDWKWVKLGDVCEKMSNGANAKQSEDKIGFPISRIETIWNETIDLGRVKYIEENDAAFVEKYSLKKDDILFSHINSDIHLGKTAIFKNQTKTLIHGINLLLIRLNKDALADFFNYQFKYKRRRGEFMSIAQKSVNQSSINQPKLKNIDFVLPPKSTQQAIVSKIEELFSGLDKGIETLRLSQQQLKTYRQAVLKWAFEGKLTNENVKEGELPEEWKIITLNEVCHKITDGSHFSPKSIDKGYPYVTVKDIKNDKIDFNGCLKISETDYLNLKATDCRPFENDVLFSKDGTVGKVSIVDYDYNFVVLSSIAILRTNLEKILPKFLFYVLKSTGFLNQALNQKKGVAIRRIILRDLKELLLNVPRIEEQHTVIQEIERRLSVADKMEESITQSLQQAEALRQSILKKAFEGRLIKY